MIAWNWEPTHPVFVDLETQSAINLTEQGAQVYLRDSTTRLLSAVFAVPGHVAVWVPTGRGPAELSRMDTEDIRPAGCEDEIGVFVQDDIPLWVGAFAQMGGTFVAHNAENFDARAWELLVKDPLPTWYDTIHTCRAAGLPAGLDRASKAIGGPGKDEQGAKALELLYRAKILGGSPVYPVGTLPLWQQMLRYNIVDVLELRRVYEATRHAREPAIQAAHCRINQRGIPVSLGYTTALRAAWEQLQKDTTAVVAISTEGGLSGDDLYSHTKVKKWLRERCGLDLLTLNRAEVEAMLRDPDGWFGDTDDEKVALAISVLQARQDSARATVGKLSRVVSILSTQDDDRVRGWATYHGAHTGRWSGRELQPHNFPRGVKLEIDGLLGEDVTLDAVRAAASDAGVSVGDALATLTRSIVRAGPGNTLVILDYASVEARGIAWVAREDRALGVFADPKQDIYCDMATSIFSRRIGKKDPERQPGKIAVLGCGYGMGANKFGVMARLLGADLAAAGVTAEQCVKAYRTAYPSIPACWRAYDTAARMAVNGTRNQTHRVAFYRRGLDLVLTLPSGRELTYRHARIEMRRPKWNPAAPEQPTLTYETGYGYRKVLYGGLIAENVVQASCRDLLADAMVQLDPCWPIVLHVHDEIVFEVEESWAERCLHAAAEIMSTPPDWADGLPLRVEGFVSKEYRKGARSSALTADYMNGRVA